MTVYTFSEARQNFAALLEKTRKEGTVLIKREERLTDASGALR